MRRTKHRFHEALAVIQNDFPEVLYPAEHAIQAGLEGSRCDVMLLFYDEADSDPFEEVWVEVFTPQGVLDAWSIFLTPPLAGEVPPAFSLDEMEFALAQHEGYVEARVDEWESHEDEGVGRMLSILVNAPSNYLDAETVFYAIDEALARIDPVAASRYELTWEHDIVPEYGMALLSHMHLSMGVYEATNREDYLRARARADHFWIQQVLPLKTYIDGTRLVEIPDYIQEAERAAAEREDQQLFAEDWQEQIAAIPPIESLLQAHAPEADPISQEIANSPGLKKLIDDLAPWEEKYPELKVQEALKWINKHRTAEGAARTDAIESAP